MSIRILAAAAAALVAAGVTAQEPAPAGAQDPAAAAPPAAAPQPPAPPPLPEAPLPPPPAAVPAPPAAAAAVPPPAVPPAVEARPARGRDSVGVEGTEGEAVTSEPGARRLLVADDADLRLRVRLQPRLDYGDLLVARDGRAYETARDVYLRRVRASLTGTLMSRFHYVLTLDGDRVNQTGRANQVSVTDAAVAFDVDEALVLRFGRAKLPITRNGLTSSARQLLPDRPLFIDAARGFGTDVNQANLLARGRLFRGAIAYYAAVADGWSPGAQIYATPSGPGPAKVTTVRNSGLLWVARLELSPPGLAESHKSDAHVGVGSHFTIGGNVVSQENIEYAEVAGHEDRHLASVDVSGHLGPLTAQAEASWSEIVSSLPARGTVRPRGWYAQVAMYVAPLQLEPALRYELDVDDATRIGARQQAITVGLNAYVRKHALKFQLAVVHRIFDVASPQRLADTDTANVGQLQMQLYL